MVPLLHFPRAQCWVSRLGEQLVVLHKSLAPYEFLSIQVAKPGSSGLKL